MNVTVVGCWGGVARAGGSCSGYLFDDGFSKLLVDCGSGVVSNIQNVCPLNSVDHVILSHWHPDHASDAGVLIHGRIIEAQLGNPFNTLTFYAPELQPDLERLKCDKCSESVAYNQDTVLSVDGYRCTFYKTKHPVECYAIKVRSLADGAVCVYTADAALDEGLIDFCRGSDVLIAECSVYENTDGSAYGHMNPLDVANLARAAGPRQLFLTHLPWYGDTGELLASVRRLYSGPCALAKELMTIDV